MTQLLRSLLQARHRHHLAVEEIDTATIAQSSEDATVVMKGPLADVYSAELNKVYNKDNPVADPAANPEATPDPAAAPAGEPTGETASVDTSGLVPAEGQTAETVEAAIISEVGNIVVESQAIDAAVAQSLAAAMSDEAPEGGDYETLYAVDETQVQPDDVKNVTTILAESDKPENVTVLIDNVVPDAVIDAANPAIADAKELAVSLESVVIAMGGKVVRGFPAYLASRRK